MLYSPYWHQASDVLGICRIPDFQSLAFTKFQAFRVWFVHVYAIYKDYLRLQKPVFQA